MATGKSGNASVRVIALDIDRDGNIAKRFPTMDREIQLDNTLVAALYPDIRLATVSVPLEPLDSYQQAKVEKSLAKLQINGVPYRLIGASGSAKNGKYYCCDAPHERTVAERFQHWPEAAISYFGILVSPCKAVIEEESSRILVVKDHELGTNDCRGWITQSLFSKLNLPAHRFYQFRLAFDKTQAKGSFKVMPDEVSRRLEADIVLPESSIKPALKERNLLQKVLGKERRFNGPVVLGIREISRRLEFESSYTLINHAPAESIQMEILPYALEQARKLTTTAAEGDFEQLLRLLGANPVQESVRDEETPIDGYTAIENSIVEAVLKADGSGLLVKYPFINNRLRTCWPGTPSS
jgi:hypothetical protein